MACLLEPLTSIENLESILNWLQGNDSDSSDENWTEAWDDWENESSSSKKPDEVLQLISNCCIAISPFGNLMAMSYADRLVILKNQKTNNGSKFCSSWQGTVSDEPSQHITAVFILPVYEHVLQKLSVKWSSVVIGFNTGHVTFFTEDALFLYDFHYCNESVRSFCANSMPINVTKPHLPPNFEDDFCVQYENGFFIHTSGNNVVKVLQESKKNKAKENAGVFDRKNVPSLPYKKYLFSEAKQINSLVYSGAQRYTPMDALIDKSQMQGFNQNLPAQLSVKMSSAMIGGMSPFFANLDLRIERDMGKGITFSQLQQTVTTELKNSVKQFTDFSSYWKTPERPVDSKPTDVSVRYALSDERRVCLSITMSPSGRLATLVDDFGRVMLVDVNKSVVLRIWKGYRNAQCAWQICDGEFQGKPRRISFLIIYCPNRGILEIWLPQSNKRAGAFNVPKDARLIYNRHTVLGANQSHVGTSLAKYDGEIYQVVFLTKEGILKTIRIPMLFGFRDIATMTDKDMYVIKGIRTSLRHKNMDEFFNLIEHVETKDMKLEVLLLVLNPEMTTLEVTQKVHDIFTKFDDTEKESGKWERHTAYERGMKTVAQLLHLYKSLMKLHQLEKIELTEQEKIDSEENNMRQVSRFMMHMQGKLMNTIQNFLPQNVPDKGRVMGDCFCQFLSGISYEKFDLPIATELTPLSIHEAKDTPSEIILSLLFRWTFTLDQFELFIPIILESGLIISDVCDAFFKYMSQRGDFSSEAILRDAHVVLLLSVFGGDRPSVDESAFWQKVQKQMRSWQDILGTLVAVNLFRGSELSYRSYYMDEDKVHPDHADEDNLTIFRNVLESVKNLHDGAESDLECEGLSLHMVDWNLLAEKLTKLVPVQGLVSKMDCFFDISLETVFAKGPGYVSEIVAKYFAVTGSNIDSFLDHRKVESTIRDIMKALYRNFPESMSKDAVRVNYIWELGVSWSKNIEQLSLLETIASQMTRLQNGFYKQGIFTLLWENRLKNHVHYAASLVFAEDALVPYALQDEQVLPEHLLGQFFEHLLVMFHSLLKGMRLCSINAEKPKVPHDPFWGPGRKYPQSLAEVCINEKKVADENVYLHLQLILSLNLSFSLAVRSHDIGTLFDELACEYLLEPLSVEYDPGNTKTSKSMEKRRKNYLSDVMEKIYDQIPLSDRLQIDYYVEKVVNLCKEWYCSGDVANTAHAVELLSSGLDGQAYNLLMDVSNREDIVEDLTLIAIHRLHFLISNTSCGNDLCGCFNFETQRELLNPTKYKTLRNPRCSIDALIRLCDKIIEFSGEESMENLMAKNLKSSLHGVNKTKIPAILEKEIS